jgi:hypothetical protein
MSKMIGVVCGAHLKGMLPKGLQTETGIVAQKNQREPAGLRRYRRKNLRLVTSSPTYIGLGTVHFAFCLSNAAAFV